MLSPSIPSTVLMILTDMASIFANMLVLLLFAYNPKLKTETSGLALNLCACDLVLGFTVLPFGIHNSLSRERHYSRDGVPCQLMGFLYILLQLGSVQSMTWATVDKFTEICFPLHYAQLFTKRKTCLVLCFLWVYCLGNACLPFFGVGSYTYSQNTFLCVPDFEPSSKSYCVVLIAVGVIVPITIMCSLYLYIIYIARKQGLRGTFECNDQHCYYVPTKNYFKSSVVLLSTALCLLVCWMPYITISFYKTFTEHRVPPLADAISIWLVLFTSAINPWVNTVTQKKYRKALKDSWKKLKQTLQLPFFSSSASSSTQGLKHFFIILCCLTF
ncbi:melanopsin-like [Polypterus senegalus]|uniref:melanopsin-like n=1 Tax=Polypterus senegalus TaxID=55291 RepID=UPI001962CF29|nr:melanopsin-like [Polypterus senegalus]